MSPVLAAVLASAVVGVVVANVLASMRIANDALSSSGQKAVQLIVVWSLPVVGSIIVFMLTQANLSPGSGRYSTEPEPQDETPEVAKIDYGSSD